MSLSRGFTLIELLLFVAIFSVVIISFMAVFVTVSQIQIRQSSSAEVASQTQFLLQTLQYYIERSSLVDVSADSATSTLRLRMGASAEDPTTIALANGQVTIQQAGNPSRVLTSDKVNVTNLQFTRRTNVPGHDSVGIALTVEYNTSNLKQQFVQSLNTGIARVSAATFDSNVVPSTGSLDLGATGSTWNSVNQIIYFANSNVGIGGVPASGAKLHITNGDVYIDTPGMGIVFKVAGGACYRLSVTASGLATTSGAAVTCP